MNGLSLTALLVVFGCAGGATPIYDGNPMPTNIVAAADSTYGYTAQNPIRVGGAEKRGPRNQRAYLDALRGPNGELLRYRRVESCCLFETPNAIAAGLGFLDIYEVTYDGRPTPLTLYLDMYNYEAPRIPQGLRWAR